METILNIFMTAMLCMVGFVGLTTVLKTVNSSKKHPAVLFGEVLAKNDLETSNALHRCNEKDCNTGFFRTYHVFEAYKAGVMEIPGDPVPDEESYTDNLPVHELYLFKLIRCPACGTTNVSQANEYDWMKTNPKFPFLTEKELSTRRKAFASANSEEAVIEKLNVAHENIKEIQEIASFNAYHQLETELDKNTDAILHNIRGEIERIIKTTKYTSVQQKANTLLELISRSGDTLFVKNSEHNNPLSINEDADRRAKTLKKAIQQYNDFHKRPRRSKKSQTPDREFQREMNLLHMEYIGIKYEKRVVSEREAAMKLVMRELNKNNEIT